MSKQDRVAPRTATDIERKYNFGKSFAEVMGIAEDARDVAEEAKEASSNPAKKLTHDEVFNLLTQNGTLQGLYRGDDGELYINAEYIKAGVLSADDVKLPKDGVSNYFTTQADLDAFIESEVDEMSDDRQRKYGFVLDADFSQTGLIDRHYGVSLSFADYGILEISVGVDADSFKSATATLRVNDVWLVRNAYSEGWKDGIEGVWKMEWGDWHYLVDTFAIEDSTHPGCFYRMVNYEKEWLNPPMEIGVEYRTTERWKGKPVYTKLFCIPIDRESDSFPTWVEGADGGGGGLVGYRLYTGAGRSIPYRTPGSDWYLNAYLDGGELYYEAGAGMAANNESLYAQPWYTKG